MNSFDISDANSQASDDSDLEGEGPQLRKVLVIYTGGTIGMKPSERGYMPAPGYLSTLVRTLPMFHDEEARYMIPSSLYTKKRGFGVPMISPETDYKQRCCFRILDYDPLLDSSDMNHSHWGRIASDIVKYYDDFDAFLVLHGTDTMAFTATALSFFLVNLKKTVVLTGSQIPLCRPRNDGLMNLLGALDIAGHFNIPEVVLYFDNMLFRGNRTTKISANALHGFDSPNLRALGTVGVNTNLEWHLIRANPVGNLRLNACFCEDVSIMRIFPGHFNSLRSTMSTLKGMLCYVMS
jgi:60kDa lysophospholipase